MMVIELHRPFYRFYNTKDRETDNIYTYELADEGRFTIERGRNKKFVVLSKAFGLMEQAINLKEFVQSITHQSCIILNQALFTSFCVRAATCLIVDLNSEFVEVTPVCGGQLCKELGRIDYELCTHAVHYEIRQAFENSGISLTGMELDEFIHGFVFVASDRKLVHKCASETKFYTRLFFVGESSEIEVNFERFMPMELFFSGKSSIERIVYETIGKCDKLFREHLLNNIWLTGQEYIGFSERLRRELLACYADAMVSVNIEKDLTDKELVEFAKECVVRVVTNDIIVSARHVVNILPQELESI